MMCRVIAPAAKWSWKLLVLFAKFLVSLLAAILFFIVMWIGIAIALTVIFASMIEISVAEKYIAYLIGFVGVAAGTGLRSYRIYKPLGLNAGYRWVGDAAYSGAIALVFLSTIGSVSSEGIAFLEEGDGTDPLTQAVGWGALAGAAVIIALAINTINRRPIETQLQFKVDSLQEEVNQLKQMHHK